MFFPDRPPRTTLARQQFVGFRRTPASRGVVWKAFGGNRGPHIQYGLNDSPARLDHVRALEQRGVADHAVVQKPFVSRAVRAPEVTRIVKFHVHKTKPHHRTGNLGAESQRDSFVGLNVNDQPVRL